MSVPTGDLGQLWHLARIQGNVRSPCHDLNKLAARPTGLKTAPRQEGASSPSASPYLEEEGRAFGTEITALNSPWKGGS